MLPDCFGFPASLPSILAHAGVKGFSTQKLNAQWQPCTEGRRSGLAGTNTRKAFPSMSGCGWPGRKRRDRRTQSWRVRQQCLYRSEPGADGTLSASAPQLTSEESARLTPEQQRAIAARQRALEQNWVKRIDLDGKAPGVFADYHYVGTGDIGGATQESTVKLLEAIVTKSETVLPSPPRAVFAMGQTPTAQPRPALRSEGGTMVRCM